MKESTTLLFIWAVMYVGYSILAEEFWIFDWEEVHRHNFGGIFMIVGIIGFIARYARKMDE